MTRTVLCIHCTWRLLPEPSIAASASSIVFLLEAWPPALGFAAACPMAAAATCLMAVSASPFYSFCFCLSCLPPNSCRHHRAWTIRSLLCSLLWLVYLLHLNLIQAVLSQAVHPLHSFTLFWVPLCFALSLLRPLTPTLLFVLDHRLLLYHFPAQTLDSLLFKQSLFCLYPYLFISLSPFCFGALLLLIHPGFLEHLELWLAS